MSVVNNQFPQFVGDCWEHLCRQYVSGNLIDGVVYNMGSRWWGKIFPEEKKEGELVELDVVAESLDKKHIFIGECKWTAHEDAARLIKSLKRKCKFLPFIKKGQQVHLALFLKKVPSNKEAAFIFLPADIL